MSSVKRSTSVIRISGQPSGVSLDLRAVIDAHRLLAFFAVRDIKVRYKQLFLGAAWAVAQPLFTTLAFTFVFGYLVRIDTGKAPYSLFSITGIVPWALFAAVANRASSSLLSNGHLMSRIYFPRLVLPLSAVGAPLVDAVVAFGIAIVLMIFRVGDISWTVVFCPLFLLLSAVVAVSLGIVLSSVVVWLRDVRQALPLMFQLWMFATPVAYPSALVPAHLSWIMSLNPMVGVVEGFRAAALGLAMPWTGIGYTLVFTALVATVGLILFNRAAERFVDIL